MKSHAEFATSGRAALKIHHQYGVRVDWGDGRPPFIAEVAPDADVAEKRARDWRLMHIDIEVTVVRRTITEGPWLPC